MRRITVCDAPERVSAMIREWPRRAEGAGHPLPGDRASADCRRDCGRRHGGQRLLPGDGVEREVLLARIGAPIPLAISVITWCSAAGSVVRHGLDPLQMPKPAWCHHYGQRHGQNDPSSRAGIMVTTHSHAKRGGRPPLTPQRYTLAADRHRLSAHEDRPTGLASQIPQSFPRLLPRPAQRTGSTLKSTTCLPAPAGG